MLLPNLEKAYILRKKLEFYLLSEVHTVGKSKAKFFRSMGFDETNIDLLEQSLLKIGQTQEVNEMVLSPHGMKYVIDGLLQTPSGSFLNVRTVWIIDPGSTDPRFVTAYPLKK